MQTTGNEGGAAATERWGLTEMAAHVAEIVLDKLGDEKARWSPGLALVCFAPPMPDRLHEEVRRRLIPELSR